MTVVTVVVTSAKVGLCALQKVPTSRGPKVQGPRAQSLRLAGDGGRVLRR